VPRQEVGDAFVAAGADDEVHVADVVVVEAGFDLFDGHVAGVEAAVVYVAGYLAGDVEEFGAAAVRECDVADEGVVVAGAALGVRDGVLDALGEAVHVADGLDAELVAVGAVGVRDVVELVGDEVEQLLALLGVALEVLGGERVERDLLDTLLLAPVEYGFGGFGSFAVSGVGVVASLAGVPAVAVLDDGDVLGRAGYLPA
jgi:hypothetical protein